MYTVVSLSWSHPTRLSCNTQERLHGMGGAFLFFFLLAGVFVYCRGDRQYRCTPLHVVFLLNTINITVSSMIVGSRAVERQ